MQKTKIDIIVHLKNIDDPRKKESSIRHKLIDILFIAICATISGANGWNDIEQYGKQKEKWLKQFIQLPNGIPSHDTFSRVFANIDPEQFKKSFVNWVRTIAKITKGEIVSIDGKTARRSYKDKNHPLHVVSAWAEKNNLVLGQTATDKKSNEIIAIPKLLELLALEGCIVTIDAMGCQKKIAEKIIKKKADYVLALKGNHGKIHKKIKQIFEIDIGKVEKYNSHKEKSKGHGRIEKRKCTSILLKDLEIDFSEKKEWPDLKSIVRIESERIIKDKKIQETRYYLSSLEANAKKFNKIIRNHWGIENSLHWVLDIAFREDESRIRKKNSAVNLGIIRHVTLNLLNQEKTLKRGLKAKRLMAAWNDDYLLKVLKTS